MVAAQFSLCNCMADEVLALLFVWPVRLADTSSTSALSAAGDVLALCSGEAHFHACSSVFSK